MRIMCFNALSGYIIISTLILCKDKESEVRFQCPIGLHHHFYECVVECRCRHNGFQCPIGLHHHFYSVRYDLMTVVLVVSMPYRATSSFLLFMNNPFFVLLGVSMPYRAASSFLRKVKMHIKDRGSVFQCPIGLHHHFYESFLQCKCVNCCCFNALSGYIIISTPYWSSPARG